MWKTPNLESRAEHCSGNTCVFNSRNMGTTTNEEMEEMSKIVATGNIATIKF